MLTRLRTVAVLMLLAGAALGVFASRALTKPRAGDVGTPAFSPRIESRVRTYVDVFDLDAGQADRVRSALVEYDRRVHVLISELRRMHAADFNALQGEAEAKIKSVLKETEK
jgi:hypothetical protein